MISLKKWKHIKVEFVANHGRSDAGCNKYHCHEIQFHGKTFVI
jgi:hypothetical protein